MGLLAILCFSTSGPTRSKSYRTNSSHGSHHGSTHGSTHGSQYSGGGSTHGGSIGSTFASSSKHGSTHSEYDRNAVPGRTALKTSKMGRSASEGSTLPPIAKHQSLSSRGLYSPPTTANSGTLSVGSLNASTYRHGGGSSNNTLLTSTSSLNSSHPAAMSPSTGGSGGGGDWALGATVSRRNLQLASCEGSAFAKVSIVDLGDDVDAGATMRCLSASESIISQSKVALATMLSSGNAGGASAAADDTAGGASGRASLNRAASCESGGTSGAFLRAESSQEQDLLQSSLGSVAGSKRVAFRDFKGRIHPSGRHRKASDSAIDLGGSDQRVRSPDSHRNA